jgi:hypothetical protein
MDFQDGFKAGFELGQKAGLKHAFTGAIGYLIFLFLVVGWACFCAGKGMGQP